MTPWRLNLVIQVKGNINVGATYQDRPETVGSLGGNRNAKLQSRSHR